MSMTREEAAKWLEETIQDTDTYFSSCSEALQKELDEQKEVFLLALSALRPVSREQVEKVWRGEWITKHYVDGILEGTNFDECSKCGYQRVFENPELKTKYMFCPGCGRAMWDEAVEMVMERLEEMKNGKGD